jgi:O-antigen ligase
MPLAPPNHRLSPASKMLAECSLIGCLLYSALAFGGAEPALFSIAQMVLFAAIAFLILAQPDSLIPANRAARVVPVVLVAVVLLQLCPLPPSWIGRSGRTPPELADARWTRWTIQTYATRTHLLALLACFAVFYLAQLVCQTREGRRRLIFSFLGLGVFEAFYGLVQYLTGFQRIFAYVKKYDLEEATGTYINRNHFAGLLEMILPFSLALAFYEFEKLRRRQAQSPRRKHKLFAGSGFARAIFWVAVAVLIGVALLFSRSRMGILAGVLSSLFLFGLVALSRLGGRSGLWLAGAFLVLGLALTLWIGPGPVLQRFQVVSDEYSGQGQDRLTIWKDTGGLLRAHPLLGTGLGTFPVAYTTVQTGFLGRFVNHTHNDYLEISSDLGVPAALVLFSSLFVILGRAVRASYSAERSFEQAAALGAAGAILAILLHSLADFNLYIFANAMMLSAILGLVMAIRPNGSSTPAAEPEGAPGASGKSSLDAAVDSASAPAAGAA